MLSSRAKSKVRENNKEKSKINKSLSIETDNLIDIKEYDNDILKTIRMKDLKSNKNDINNDNKITLEYLEKDSNNVLSPHNSVFKVLNNPDLNKGVDLSNLKTIFTKEDSNDSNNNNNLNDDILDESDNSNLDFSITSWQNISSYFNQDQLNQIESRSNSQNSDSINNRLLFNLSSNNNSNIISSGNNSPSIRNDGLFISNSPIRIDSPNVASILSGVSGNDESDDSKNIKLNDANSLHLNKTITNDNNNNNNNNTLNYDSDTDLDHTVDSSTIISSFVMPRVSIHSNLTFSQSNSNSKQIIRSKLNIRIIGNGNINLMKRFKSYKKTLTNIDFYVTNCEFTDLIILIVNNDNYMLPKITKTPCIPIILSNNDLLISEKIPNDLKLCDSIKLNSLDDNLIILIDFLSNINDLKIWKSFLSNLPINNNNSNNNNINDINSSLIEFYSENKNKINSNLPFSNENIGTNINDKTFNNNDDDNDNNNKNNRKGFIDFIKSYFITGFTVGILSIGVLFIWKKLTNNDLIEENLAKQVSDVSVYKPLSSIQHDLNNPSTLSFESFIYSKIKLITDTIEYLGDIAFSQSVMLIQKAKLILVDLFNF